MLERQKLEIELTTVLSIIRQLLATRERKQFSKVDLNPSQFHLLHHFLAQPNRSWTVTELSLAMEMNQSGLTKILSVMLEKDLLTVTRGDNDKRLKKYEITTTGRDTVLTIGKALMPDISNMFQQLSDHEIRSTSKNLKKLLNWLDNQRDDIKL